MWSMSVFLFETYIDRRVGYDDNSLEKKMLNFDYGRSPKIFSRQLVFDTSNIFVKGYNKCFVYE